MTKQNKAEENMIKVIFTTSILAFTVLGVVAYKSGHVRSEMPKNQEIGLMASTSSPTIPNKSIIYQYSLQDLLKFEANSRKNDAESKKRQLESQQAIIKEAEKYCGVGNATTSLKNMSENYNNEDYLPQLRLSVICTDYTKIPNL